MGEALFPATFFQALERLARRPPLAGNGQKLRPRPGSGRLGFEHRDYQPGDDLRRVDWRASARSRHWQVRRTEQETGGLCVLVLDRSASLCPIHPRRDFDQRRLALALAWVQLETGGAVGIVAGRQPPRLFAGLERRPLLQDFLQGLPPPAEADEEALAPALPRFSRAVGTSRVVFLGDPWGGEAWWRLLAQSRPRVAAMKAVELVLPEEAQPPAEALRLTAVEQSRTLEVDLAAGKREFRRAWQQWCQQRRRRSLELGAEFHSLSCAELGAPSTLILQAAEAEGLV
ncbi:MAG: DUF58 domain-containing protein [Planctomycetota bacterium]|nr:MAG: DUF58 domain-containing protein [Planctomycetota bacterium]